MLPPPIPPRLIPKVWRALRTKSRGLREPAAPTRRLVTWCGWQERKSLLCVSCSYVCVCAMKSEDGVGVGGTAVLEGEVVWFANNCF